MDTLKWFNNKFINQSFTYLVFGALTRGIPFFLLPILTRYLDTSAYGLIAMFMTFVSAVSIFLGVGGIEAVGVYFFRMERGQFKLFFGNVLVIWFFSSLGILIFIYLFNEPLSLLLNIQGRWLFAGVILASAQFVILLSLSLWQCEQNARAFGIYQVFQMVLDICLSLILVIHFGMGWEGRVTGIITAALFFLCGSFFILVGRGFIKWEFKPDYIKNSLNLGVPLIPYKFSSWAMLSLVPFFITHIKGLPSTGLYWVTYQIGYIVLIFASEIMRAYFPQVFERLKDSTDEDKRQIVRLTYICFAAILAVAVMLGFISYHFLHIFLGPDFIDAASLVAWLALGQALSGMQSLLGQFLLYGKKTSWLSIIMSVAVLIHACLCYFLIKVSGVLGATQATAVSYFILFVVTWALTTKIYKLPWITFFKTT